MRRFPLISFLAALLLLACSNTTQQAPATEENPAVSAVSDTIAPEELPLPQLPATLRDPAERAGYLIQHFWDAMNFNDTVRSHNTDFMEQNFANFVSVFPYASEEARRGAVSALMGKVSADPEAYQLLVKIADHYLYDPNSPMLDEETYIPFLEEFIVSPLLDEATTTRLKHQLRFARLNRPGTTTADFAYTTRDGQRKTLYTTHTEGLLLLLFYDPDCEHCQEVMPQVASSAVLNELVGEGRLDVLAIYADEDRELWKKTNAELPSSWTVGMDTGGINEKGLYSLRALPSMYLLDTRKKVILKDAPLNLLENYLIDLQQ